MMSEAIQQCSWLSVNFSHHELLGVYGRWVDCKAGYAKEDRNLEIFGSAELVTSIGQSGLAYTPAN